MRFRDKGFLPWLGWALLSWRGSIKRMPYAVSFFCLLLVTPIYVRIAAESLAVYLLPPPPGVELNPAYVRGLAGSAAMLPLLLPVLYVFVALDIKRLRSAGGPLILAVIFAVLTLAGPIFAPGAAEMLSLTGFAYHAILAVIPAKEDRISPQERKYRTWRAIATGDGSPRRLAGKDVKVWHVVRRPSDAKS